MIYRHVAVIDGEMVHFEILDTAGQVSTAGKTPSEQSGLPGRQSLLFHCPNSWCLEHCGVTSGEKGEFMCNLSYSVASGKYSPISV